MTFIIAPDVGTYSTRTQYVTANEFKAAPTGVDTSQLVPGGSVAANTQALEMQLQRASAWADNFCNQTIAATVNTQSGLWRVRNIPGVGPAIKVPLDFTPILGVTDVQTGPQPSGLTELADYTNLWISDKSVTIPVASCHAYGWWGSGSDMYATVQYVNGYANTALTSPAAAGDTTLTVASPLGIMPGQQINVQGATGGETVTISPAWVPQTTGIAVTVPISTPLVGSYLVGDTVTAFPQDIKQAIILIAKSLILVPGDQALVIPVYGQQPTQSEQLAPQITNDLDIAEDLLLPYRRVI